MAMLNNQMVIDDYWYSTGSSNRIELMINIDGMFLWQNET